MIVEPNEDVEGVRYTAALEQRIEALRTELESSPAAEDDRTRIRDELVALVRDVDTAIDELEVLREAIKPLAERYKERYPRRVERTADRVDHLGASTFRERGWSALAAGEYEESVRALRNALALDPDEISSSVMLAWAHLRLGEEREADELLRVALDRDPHHPLGQVILGYRQIRSGSVDEAIRNLTAVTSARGDRTATLYAHLYLGLAHAERQMHRDAQSFFRTAIELGPNLTEAYWELGRSHYGEGRHDLALEAWRAGGENRFNPWGERCRAEVERMQAEEHAGGA